MKKLSVCLVMVLLLLSPSASFARDYSGEWRATVSESVSWCKNIGKAPPGEYKLIIVQTDTEITIQEEKVKRPYKGVVNPKRPGHVNVSGAYSEHGGYISQLVDIVFENETTGKGESAWSWSDGIFHCGGRFKFSLEKIK